MAYLNKVQLIGNLGKDPEIRVNQQTERKVVSFSLATSRRYRDNNGEQKEDTQWHNIVGWGKVAEVVEQLGIHKGMSLYVEGRLTNRSWTDQTSGQKRYVTEINMDTFQLLTPRGTQNGSGYGAQGQGQQRQAYQQQEAQGYGDEDVDLPF
ncbi:single-stranded DNA-binding protein [Fibrobacter succinogenes]|uniref:single-stranded DNA-binding protein n=1 Tax=Fibrobacter succinogenes TaxID=833 RepID=UPI0015681BA3|nr:single-stranded DNA-binding protein [Fibrobacter succinogenes]